MTVEELSSQSLIVVDVGKLTQAQKVGLSKLLGDNSSDTENEMTPTRVLEQLYQCCMEDDPKMFAGWKRGQNALLQAELILGAPTKRKDPYA